MQFAFFFNLDADAGCDPANTTTGRSQGLAALANVSAHELSDARCDPASPGAWYYSSGAENGDPWAWTFNVPSVTLTTATVGKLQREWSITAYTVGTGCADSAGSKGRFCRSKDAKLSKPLSLPSLKKPASRTGWLRTRLGLRGH